jgi:hypothetical protein
MTKAYFIAFALTFFIYSNIISQSVSGKILDSLNVPVPFSTIALLRSNDSSLVKGNISNDKGEYFFEKLAPGNYLIKAVFVGYNDFYSSVFRLDSTAKFKVPDISLQAKGINLNEVSVVSIKQAVEFKNGMIVLNVEDSPLSVGNNVFELLKRLPGVYVDNQNNITLNGKSGVTVMIDGRQQRLSGQQLVSVLSSMSSDQLSKIELMNNPPAKYDAAGTTGIINVITKKVKLVGFSGSLNAGGSKGVVYRGSADAALNYKGKKVTIFSNIGYANRDFYSKYVFDKTVTYKGNATYMNEDGEQVDTQKSLTGRIGADWYVTDKTTIGFLASGGPGASPMTDKGINRVSGYNDIGFDYSLFNVKVTDDWQNPNYNMNFEHTFDTLGTTLNFSSDYSSFTGKRRANSDNYFLDPDGNNALNPNVIVSQHITDVKIFTQKLDFKKNLSKTLEFETGAKATFVDNSNVYTLQRLDIPSELFILDTLVSNNYKYTENIYAAYFNFAKQLKKSSFQVGARGENTVVDALDKISGFHLIRNYFNFFPNVSYDLNSVKNQSFQFKISRRINRPGYNDLNPYKSYQDNYSVTTGNPFLLPQLNLNYSFTHGYKNTLFNTITFVQAKNFILRYDSQNDSTKETNSSIANLSGNNYHIWYSIFFQKQITKWWNVNVSTYMGYMHYEGILNGLKYERTYFDYNASLNNDIVLPKSFKIQVSAFYASPNLYGVFLFKPRWSFDVGIKKSFFDKKLTVNFSVFDIFYTNVERLTAKYQGLNVIFNKPNDTRRGWLAINYKFGKIRVQKRQAGSNDEEKGRLDGKLQK